MAALAITLLCIQSWAQSRHDWGVGHFAFWDKWEVMRSRQNCRFCGHLHPSPGSRVTTKRRETIQGMLWGERKNSNSDVDIKVQKLA